MEGRWSRTKEQSRRTLREGFLVPRPLHFDILCLVDFNLKGATENFSFLFNKTKSLLNVSYSTGCVINPPTLCPPVPFITFLPCVGVDFSH